MPGFRYETGFLFGGLYHPDGSLVEIFKGIGELKHVKVRDLVMSRTRSATARAADVAALSAADLEMLSADEWGVQQAIQFPQLDILLPVPLRTIFEYWRTSERTLWGYRSWGTLYARSRPHSTPLRWTCLPFLRPLPSAT